MLNPNRYHKQHKLTKKTSMSQTLSNCRNILQSNISNSKFTGVLVFRLPNRLISVAHMFWCLQIVKHVYVDHHSFKLMAFAGNGLVKCVNCGFQSSICVRFADLCLFNSSYFQVLKFIFARCLMLHIFMFMSCMLSNARNFIFADFQFVRRLWLAPIFHFSDFRGRSYVSVVA